MNRSWLVFACAGFLPNVALADGTGLLPERVATAAQERIAVEMYPTLAIGVVDGDKSGIVTFGKLPDGSRPDGDTVYEIGSVTKTFTATLLAEALQAGRVELATPVAQLLPDFKIPAKDGKEITLLDIATQHSGLPRLPTNLAPADPANPYADYDAARLKQFLEGYSLPRDPGAQYEYSNLAVGLLGYALAASAQTGYDALVSREILRPLGMEMSGAAFTEAMRAHLAPPTDQLAHPVKNWDLDALVGAGGLRSTAADMVRYLKANMGLTETPLGGAMALAQQPRREIGKSDRIGLIWMTREDPDGAVIWHNGMTGGYASFLGFRADRSRGVVILTNVDNSVDDLGFAALLDDAPLSPAHKAIAMAAGALDEYIGIYKIADGFFLEINRGEDQLYAQATGQGPFPIFPSATNEFFAKDSGISMSFTRNDDGAVSGLVLHQNGDRTAPKLSATDLPGEPVAIRLGAAVLGDYVGKFKLRPGAVVDITLAGEQLSVQLTGQDAFPIYASDRDKFFLKIVDAQIAFERDEAGKVIALVLHQNGRDQRAPRTGS
jgi:serine-type D-Ala-D-Ala carboxypeptidase/endopeptidase